MIDINNQMLNFENLNQYIICDSKQFIDHIPKNVDPFIDLIVTSPPYWDLKKYGEVEQTGYKQTYEEYLNDIEKTFASLYKVSKDTATLYINSDTIKRNGRVIRLPDDIARKLEGVGWIHQDVIIWDKGKTLPWSRKGQMRNTFEYIHIFTKTTNYKYYIERIKTIDELKEWWIDYPERYSPEGKVPDNIWEYFIPTQGSWGSKKDFGETEFKHACPFPPDMMARIIKLSSDEGDVVFDPYAGTGTLLATADLLKRRFLGLDTNPEYKQIFEQVTKPLVEEKMYDINKYYEDQERGKELLFETIFKLRVLKYPKAMIKQLNNILKNGNDNDEQNHAINSVIVIKEKMNDSEKNEKYKIGKAKYYYVINPNRKYINGIKLLLNLLSENAPFSKYGLISDIKLITTEEAINFLMDRQENFYLYSKGIVNDSIEQITLEDISRKIQDFNENIQHTEKGIPPIFSNIEIKKDDYREIPAKKLRKKEKISNQEG